MQRLAQDAMVVNGGAWWYAGHDAGRPSDPWEGGGATGDPWVDFLSMLSKWIAKKQKIS
jgi:hypothetical protein